MIEFGADKQSINYNQESKNLQYQAFPLAKNKILVRFENLADRFDVETSLAIKYVDVRRFARQFYQQSNNGDLPKWISLDEVNHSGNILVSELKKENTY